MVSADAGTVTVQYTRHSHHHRIKSSIPPDQLGPPYPSLTILYQVHHVSLGGISCSGMRLILGGIKKSLVVGTSIAGPRQLKTTRGERRFFFLSLTGPVIFSWHAGKGLVMMRFFVHYTVYYTSLAFLLLLLLLLLLITGDRTKKGPLGFIGLDFYERLTRG